MSETRDADLRDGWVLRTLGLDVRARLAPPDQSDAKKPKGTPPQPGTNPPSPQPGTQTGTQTGTQPSPGTAPPTTTPTPPPIIWPRAAELDQVHTLVADLRRWGAPGGTAVSRSLRSLRTAAKKQPLDPGKLDRVLDALWNKVRLAHARGQVLVKHWAECELLQPAIVAADTAITLVTPASRAEPQHATLDAAITEYADAKADLAAFTNDNATDLANKRQRVSQAAKALIDAFAAQRISSSVAVKVGNQYGPLNERAGLVKPRTLEQARLQNEHAAARSGTLDEVLDKAAKAQALLNQVQADANQPPIPDEAAYVKLLAASLDPLNYANAVKAPLIKLGKKKDLALAVAAFGKALAVWQPLDTGLPAGAANDRFTKALAALRPLIARAKDLVALQQAKVAGTTDKLLNDVGTTDPAAKKKLTKNASSLVKAADPVLLASLTPKQQAGLLKALRANPDFEGSQNDAYEALQAKMYRATKLDPGFLQYEAAKRAEIIQDLVAGPGKAELQQSRDEWPVMNEAAKMKTVKKLVDAHCAKLGFDAPSHIVFNDDDPGTSGSFSWGTGTLNINRGGYGFNDFELMVDTVFHENSHNWQMQIAQRMRGEKLPAIDDTDDIHTMALLFDANHQHRSDEAYEDQPKEKHSFRAGPKTARALLRALV